MRTGYFQWDWHTIFLNNQCFIILYLHQHIDSVFISFRAQKKDECKHFEKSDSHKISKLLVKVNFRMQSSFLSTLSGFLPSQQNKAEILTNFCSYFERNDDFTNSFWKSRSKKCVNFIESIPELACKLLFSHAHPLYFHLLLTPPLQMSPRHCFWC